MLVGGYNPSEKYESQLGRIIPYIMEKVWNNQPDHHHIPIVIAYESHY